MKPTICLNCASTMEYVPELGRYWCFYCEDDEMFSDEDATEELELDSCWDDVPDEYFQADYFEDDGKRGT